MKTYEFKQTEIDSIENEILLAKFEYSFDDEWKMGYINGLESFMNRYKQSTNLIDLKRYINEVINEGLSGSYMDGFIYSYKSRLTKLEKQLNH